MAQAKQCLPAEQIVEICAQNNEPTDRKHPRQNLEVVIQMSVNQFLPLRNQLVSYFRFRTEVCESLKFLFKKNEHNADPLIEKALKSKVEMWPVLSVEVSPRARNP